MYLSGKHRLVALATLVIGLLVYVECSRPQKPEEETLRRYTVGIVTWIGYGPLFVAREKGFFRDEGFDIDIRIMDGPGEREAAYLAGKVDFFPNTPDAFAIFASQGHAGKIVMPLDESQGADGLVAKRDIRSLRELRGRTVGFQSGITSHFFLLYLLDSVGLAGSDVRQENLGAGEAGAAFVAGKLDAAVTWEPWLSKARQLPQSHVLASSRDTPGLLADLLMVPDRVISNDHEDVIGFIRAWWKGVEYLKDHPDESQKIIGRALNLKEKEVAEILTTTHFFTIQEALAYFGTKQRPGRAFQVFSLAAKLYKDNGVIYTLPGAANQYFEPALLAEAAEGH